VVVAADAESSAIEAQALVDERVRQVLAGREPRKVIVVPGRMVSIVV
jgi:leucyl-tRNA synthetase